MYVLDSSIRWLRLPLAKSSFLKLRANNDSVKRFRESIQSEERTYDKVSEVRKFLVPVGTERKSVTGDS